jgi:anaerobic selenocysteine-containing dehydrogenase
MSTPGPNYDDITDWAFAFLTMRVNIPPGWLPEDFDRAYTEGWEAVAASHGEDLASEYAILDLGNMAAHLVAWLAAATGLSSDHWLQQLRREYVRWAAATAVSRSVAKRPS